MTLPEGATIEFATDPDAVRYVIDHPRQIECDSRERYNVDPVKLLAIIMECPERWLIRMKGVPVACFYAFIQHGFIEWEICCTPEIDKYPVAYTRGTRAFIRTAQQDYPTHRHVVHAMVGSPQHRWLNVIGFNNVGDPLTYGSGKLQLMELGPP